MLLLAEVPEFQTCLWLSYSAVQKSTWACMRLPCWLMSLHCYAPGLKETSRALNRDMVGRCVANNVSAKDTVLARRRKKDRSKHGILL